MELKACSLIARLWVWLSGKCTRLFAILAFLALCVLMHLASLGYKKGNEMWLSWKLEELRQLNDNGEEATIKAIHLYQYALDINAGNFVLEQCAKELERRKAAPQASLSWALLMQREPSNAEYVAKNAQYLWFYERKDEALNGIRIAITLQPHRSRYWELLALWSAAHHADLVPATDYAKRAVLEAKSDPDGDAKRVRERLAHILRPRDESRRVQEIIHQETGGESEDTRSE